VEKTELNNYLIEAHKNSKLISDLIELEFSDRNIELGKELAHLHNDGDLNLLSPSILTSIYHLKNNEFWMVFSVLEDAIEHLDDEYETIYRYVECLVEKAGNDGCANMPNAAFMKWCRKNSLQAKQILMGSKQKDEICLKAAVLALLGLNDLSQAVDFINSEDDTLKGIGLRALGKLENMSATDNKCGIDDCLSILQEGGQADVRVSAIEAAFRIWDKDSSGKKYKQTEFIDLLLKDADNTDLVQLAAMLFYCSNAAEAETIKKILSHLGTIADNYDGALHWIESALTWKDERWSFEDTAKLFEVLLPKLENKNLAEKFNAFAEWVWAGPENVSFLFARWLNNGNFKLCSFLADIVGKGAIKGGQIEILAKDVPKEKVDQIFMARKCIGHLWLHEVTTASILISIIECGHEDVQQDLEQWLWNPLLLSYGGDLKEYLESLSEDKSQNAKDVVSRLLKKHEAYIADLQTDDDLCELEPSTVARRAAAQRDYQRNSDIQKMAHSESAFAGLFHTSTMLYGKKSFTMITGMDGQKFPSINQLGEHSYSMEFPRLSVMDPVGFNNFLTICRAEQKINS